MDSTVPEHILTVLQKFEGQVETLQNQIYEMKGDYEAKIANITEQYLEKQKERTQITTNAFQEFLLDIIRERPNVTELVFPFHCKCVKHPVELSDGEEEEELPVVKRMVAQIFPCKAAVDSTAVVAEKLTTEIELAEETHDNQIGEDNETSREDVDDDGDDENGIDDNVNVSADGSNGLISNGNNYDDDLEDEDEDEDAIDSDEPLIVDDEEQTDLAESHYPNRPINSINPSGPHNFSQAHELSPFHNQRHPAQCVSVIKPTNSRMLEAALRDTPHRGRGGGTVGQGHPLDATRRINHVDIANRISSLPSPWSNDRSYPPRMSNNIPQTYNPHPPPHHQQHHRSSYSGNPTEDAARHFDTRTGRYVPYLSNSVPNLSSAMDLSGHRHSMAPFDIQQSCNNSTANAWKASRHLYGHTNKPCRPILPQQQQQSQRPSTSTTATATQERSQWCPPESSNSLNQNGKSPITEHYKCIRCPQKAYKVLSFAVKHVLTKHRNMPENIKPNREQYKDVLKNDLHITNK